MAEGVAGAANEPMHRVTRVDRPTGREQGAREPCQVKTEEDRRDRGRGPDEGSAVAGTTRRRRRNHRHRRQIRRCRGGAAGRGSDEVAAVAGPVAVAVAVADRGDRREAAVEIEAASGRRIDS